MPWDMWTLLQYLSDGFVGPTIAALIVLGVLISVVVLEWDKRRNEQSPSMSD